MGINYTPNVNCIHFDRGACNKKPKVFFCFFRQWCMDPNPIGYQPCPMIQPHPKPKVTPQGHKNICDVCRRIMNKDW